MGDLKIFKHIYGNSQCSKMMHMIMSLQKMGKWSSTHFFCCDVCDPSARDGYGIHFLDVADDPIMGNA